MRDKRHHKNRSLWVILACTIAIMAAGLWLPQRIGICATWAIVAILMIFIIWAIGTSLGKGCNGALIDPLTNTMSLSRLQIILWTWVILSAFVTIALARIADSGINAQGYKCDPDEKTPCAEPVNVQIPPLLWALMGISITSAVGSPLIKADKAQKTSAQDAANEAAASSGGGPKIVTYAAIQANRLDKAKLDQVGAATAPLGAIFRKASYDKAMFSDMFTGEEVSTFGYVNIAKVQNLLFTVVAVVSYIVAIYGLMSENANNVANLIAFPSVSEGLVALIGISHGGYLADKAVTHSTPAVAK